MKYMVTTFTESDDTGQTNIADTQEIHAQSPEQAVIQMMEKRQAQLASSQGRQPKAVLDDLISVGVREYSIKGDYDG